MLELIFKIPEFFILIASFVSLIRLIISSVSAPHLSIKSFFILFISSILDALFNDLYIFNLSKGDGR